MQIFKAFFRRFDSVAFISEIISVILGIVITFAIQDIVDYRKTRTDLRAALGLVADELRTCRSDLEGCGETIEKEVEAADYFLLNVNRLSRCPKDTVYSYGMRLVNPSVLTMSYEALDMLKISSLFQAIDDERLSMSILHAYDICKVLQEIFNDHENEKQSLFRKACRVENMTDVGSREAMLDFPEMMLDRDVRSVIVTLRLTSPKTITNGLPYLDETIEMIEKYLNR